MTSVIYSGVILQFCVIPIYIAIEFLISVLYVSLCLTRLIFSQLRLLYWSQSCFFISFTFNFLSLNMLNFVNWHLYSFYFSPSCLRQSTFMVCMLRCSIVSWHFAAPWIVDHQLLCPWNFPNRNTAVCYHLLFQGIVAINCDLFDYGLNFFRNIFLW